MTRSSFICMFLSPVADQTVDALLEGVVMVEGVELYREFFSNRKTSRTFQILIFQIRTPRSHKISM